MKKKIAMLLATASLLTLFTGCSNKTSTSGSPADSIAPSSSSAATEPAPVTIRALFTSAEALETAKIVGQMYKEIEERSEGKIKFEITYNASTVFAGESEILSMVRNGSADIANVSPTYFNAYADEIDVTSWPYVFESSQHIFNYFNSDVAEELVGKIESGAGVHMITPAYMGVRNLSTKETPVRTPADLSGLKIRCMDSNIYVAGTEAMGATAVPIPYSELYFSLQTNVADGQENQMSTINESKVYEVQKYISKTAHLYAINLFVANADFWSKLDPSYQQIITDVMKDYMENIYREKVDEIDAEYEQGFIDYGVTIIDDVDTKAFVDQCGSAFKDRYSDKPSWLALYDQIKSVA